MEGKFRYTRIPQGASFAGDAYNRRHATITAEFPRKETVVDDTCHYDNIDELEQHWWRTIDYLILCGKNGIILNPEKFQFARTTVDFAGFLITNSTIERDGRSKLAMYHVKQDDRQPLCYFKSDFRESK